MWDDVVKATPILAPWLAVVISLATGFFGVCGYLLSKKIQNELKGDEVLIAGVLQNPSLSHPDHENCVIQTKFFNKSKRKAYINKVMAFDAKGEEIEITWSDQIDKYGNPQGTAQLIGVVDSAWLCMRRNDGEAFRSTRIEITHSFDHLKPLVLSYDIAAGWQEYFAR
jgi:hypothetical protein